jgi:hypothetical protein
LFFSLLFAKEDNLSFGVDVMGGKMTINLKELHLDRKRRITRSPEKN